MARRPRISPRQIIPKSHLRAAGDAFMAATFLERDIMSAEKAGRNPFLVQLYHAFQEKDRLVMVMEYYQAGSLHMHVNISLKEERRGFTEPRACFYLAEVASAIEHLHSYSVIHRDLKLENVRARARRARSSPPPAGARPSLTRACSRPFSRRAGAHGEERTHRRVGFRRGEATPP